MEAVDGLYASSAGVQRLASAIHQCTMHKGSNLLDAHCRRVFIIRPLLAPEVQLLSALGPWQILLVYNCP